MGSKPKNVDGDKKKVPLGRVLKEAAGPIGRRLSTLKELRAKMKKRVTVVEPEERKEMERERGKE